MKYKLTFKIQILIIITFGILVSINCSNKSRSNDSNSLIGFWQSPEEDDWKFVYEIKKDSFGNYEGKVHSFWFGSKEIESTIKEINYKHPHLEFISNSEANIKNEFEVDFKNQKLVGKILYGDGSEKSWILERVKEIFVIGLYPRRKTANEKYTYVYNQPEELNDGLATANSKSQGIEPELVKQTVEKIISGEYGSIHSFLVVRNNKLVIEEYFYGRDRETLHSLSSATKSIVSLLIGLTKDRGNITNVQEKLFSFFPEYNSIKTSESEKITLEHVLAMKTGFQHEEEKWRSSSNKIKTLLERNVIQEPGKIFNYDNGGANLLNGIIKNVTRIHADKFAEKYLFQPLNIKKYNWDFAKQNGFPDGSGSLRMRPRDMAKIGMLVLNHGKWQGKQIISSNWIDKSTRSHSIINPGKAAYGYQWWILWHEIEGKKFKAIFASGSGSKFIFIIPDLDLVTVFTGGNFNMKDHYAPIQMLEKYILKAII